MKTRSLAKSNKGGNPPRLLIQETKPYKGKQEREPATGGGDPREHHTAVLGILGRRERPQGQREGKAEREIMWSPAEKEPGRTRNPTTAPGRGRRLGLGRSEEMGASRGGSDPSSPRTGAERKYLLIDFG